MRRALVLLPEAEQREFHQQFHDTVAMSTDENWICESFQNKNSLLDYLNDKPVLNALNWDLSLDREVDGLKSIRQQYQDAFLMILADSSISPMAYIRPGILPDSLLLKPYTRAELDKALREMLVGCEERTSDENAMVIHTRENDYRIPYSQICWVEARQKKLFVRTKSEEFGFYGTIEDVKQMLPIEFVQCHRSYIVNLSKILRLDLANQIAEMEDGMGIPIARSYKKSIKEQWNRK